MLRLAELKLPLDHTDVDLTQAVLRRLRIPPEQLLEQRLVKRSIDARRRDRIQLIYSLDVRVKGEANLLRRIGNKGRVRLAPDTRYRSVGHAPDGFPLDAGDRPVVVGAGPCGYFAALLLAQMGFRPLLLERGQAVKQRTADTFGFWRGTSPFNPESNAQFGEGGAGTFSDGKLYSQVSDPEHYGRKVLE
ncbi:MAG: FAD-dependent oxidoreductase, partial [Cyanobium sp. RS427]|nr:FAD-dependent oxidoreductase [Cyanobium sp. RS427]